MPENSTSVAEIGVKLSLDASNFNEGIGKASGKLNAFQEAASKAASGVQGMKAGGGTSAPGSSRSSTQIDLSLSVTQSQIRKLKTQIQEGLGVIKVQIEPVIKRQGDTISQIGSVVGDMIGSSPSQGRSAVIRSVERSLGPLPKKAHGGSVQQGRPVIVGERRPEVFVPEQNGKVFADLRAYYTALENQALAEERERQRHQARIARIRGGGVRGYGGKYGAAKPAEAMSYARYQNRIWGSELPDQGFAYHLTHSIDSIRRGSVHGLGVQPTSSRWNGQTTGGPRSFWTLGGTPLEEPHLISRGISILRTPIGGQPFYDLDRNYDQPWRGGILATERPVPRRALQYWGDDNRWHKFRKGRARFDGGGVISAFNGRLKAKYRRLDNGGVQFFDPNRRGKGIISAERYFQIPPEQRMIPPLERRAYERQMASYERLTPDDIEEARAWYPLVNLTHQSFAALSGLPMERIISAASTASPRARFPREHILAGNMAPQIAALLKNNPNPTPEQLREISEFARIGVGGLKGNAFRAAQVLAGTRTLIGRKVTDYRGSIIDADPLGQHGRLHGKPVPPWYTNDIWMNRMLQGVWKPSERAAEWWAARTGGARAAYDIERETGIVPFDLQAASWIQTRRDYNVRDKGVVSAQIDEMFQRAASVMGRSDVLQRWGRARGGLVHAELGVVASAMRPEIKDAILHDYGLAPGSPLTVDIIEQARRDPRYPRLRWFDEEIAGILRDQGLPITDVIKTIGGYAGDVEPSNVFRVKSGTSVDTLRQISALVGMQGRPLRQQQEAALWNATGDDIEALQQRWNSVITGVSGQGTFSQSSVDAIAGSRGERLRKGYTMYPAHMGSPEMLSFTSSRAGLLQAVGMYLGSRPTFQERSFTEFLERSKDIAAWTSPPPIGVYQDFLGKSGLAMHKTLARLAPKASGGAVEAIAAANMLARRTRMPLIDVLRGMEPILGYQLAEEMASKKASGGSAPEGVYIVGEIGPELFVPNKMSHLIPKKVMDNIPKAAGGMQVIGQKRNELFFPPEDGTIIPNRFLHLFKGAATGTSTGRRAALEAKGVPYLEVLARSLQEALTRAQGERDPSRYAASQADARELQETLAQFQQFFIFPSGQPSQQPLGAHVSASGLTRGWATLAKTVDNANRLLQGASRRGGVFDPGTDMSQRHMELAESIRSREASMMGSEKLVSARNPMGIASAALSYFGFGGYTARKQAEARQANIQLLQSSRELDLARAESEERDRQAGVQPGGRRIGYKRDQQLIAKLEAQVAAEDKKSQELTAKGTPKALSFLGNFATVAVGIQAYSAVMQGLQAVMESGALAVGRLSDAMGGFEMSFTKVTTALGGQLGESGGSMGAVFGQAAQRAGLGGEAMYYLQAALGSSIYAKAGAQAQAQASDLFKAAAGVGNAPSGLIGGYGGLFGGSLFAEQMGGGRGFLEIIKDDVNAANARRQRIALEESRKGGPGRTAGPWGQLFRFVTDAIGGANPLKSPFEPKPLSSEALGELAALDANQQQMFDDLNVAADRSDDLRYRTTEGRWTPVDQTAVDQYVSGLDALGDLQGEEVEARNYLKDIANESGMILADMSGEALSLGRAMGALAAQAEGKSIPDLAGFEQETKRQYVAQQLASGAMTQRALDLQIPAQLGASLAANPLLAAGVGFLPADMTSQGMNDYLGSASGFVMQMVNETKSAQDELNRLAEYGLRRQEEDIRLQESMNPQMAGRAEEWLSYMDAVIKSGKVIKELREQVSSAQANANAKSYANSLRLANRAIADALGMAGEAGGSRLGQMQREQQMLSFALQQRQITTNLALAGFLAPGDTGEERYARQQQAMLEASIAQRQLNLSKGVFGEQVARGVEDTRLSKDVMVASHNAQLAAMAASERIAAEQQLQSQNIAAASAIVQQSEASFSANLQRTTAYIGQFGSAALWAATATRFMGQSAMNFADFMGLVYGRETYGTITTGVGGKALNAEGFLGTVNSATEMIMGEAGPETVAILRNPRRSSLSGDGGGSTSLTININGPVVRADQDINSLAEVVAEKVERVLARKGQMLGLRQTAY